MKKTLLLLALLAGSAFSGWTASGVAPILVFTNVGCGPDAGKSFAFLSFPSTGDEAYVLRSDSPLFQSSLSLLERGVAEQLPVTLFVRESSPTVKFNYQTDMGTCAEKEWPEIIGVSLSKR